MDPKSGPPSGYLVLFGLIVYRQRQSFAGLGRNGWLVFGILAVLIPPAHRLAAVTWTQQVVIPPGPMSILPFSSSISLPGLALIGAAAYILGPGPGLLAGLIGGLTWARYTPLILTDVLALSMWGYLVGVFLHQHYRGDIFAFLRQPLVAVILSSFVTVLLLSLSRLASSRLADGPRIIDFVVVLWRNELPLWLFCGAGLGAMLQAVTLNPKWRLPQRGDVPSFYSRSLSAQFMVERAARHLEHALLGPGGHESQCGPGPRAVAAGDAPERGDGRKGDSAVLHHRPQLD